MMRYLSVFKVLFILILDYGVLFHVWGNTSFTMFVMALMMGYVWLGGHLTLFKEGAINSKKLPAFEKKRLEEAKQQLTEEIKRTGDRIPSGLKVYLVPGEDQWNATAYGCNCISVTRGMFDNTDPLTLQAIMAHEVSHIENYDPEFNRAIFASVTLMIGSLSVISAVCIVLIFILFLAFRCFQSWLGLMAFQGTRKLVGGCFKGLQYTIVMIYRTFLGLASRHAEFRCDAYSCSLGYGSQLIYFLSIIASAGQQPRLTLTEALYQSHPPIEKRIAYLERLEKQSKREEKCTWMC